MALYFYDVNPDYVKYLKAYETAARGFTRVPDVEYEHSKKLVCGVVLKINEHKYYVPVSSYKVQQANNVLIQLQEDRFDQIKGSLRFNYMFPVPNRYITKRDFNTEKSGRKEFLRRQWAYCNSIQDDIEKLAQTTYNDVISKANPNLVHSSCDFKLLEQAAAEYIKLNSKK